MRRITGAMRINETPLLGIGLRSEVENPLAFGEAEPGGDLLKAQNIIRILCEHVLEHEFDTVVKTTKGVGIIITHGHTLAVGTQCGLHNNRSKMRHGAK